MRIIRCIFHLIGIALAIFLMGVDAPGFDPFREWLLGSIISNVVFIIITLIGGDS